VLVLDVATPQIKYRIFHKKGWLMNNQAWADLDKEDFRSLLISG